MLSHRDIISQVNPKQKRTFAAIYTDPIPASIDWKDIESFFLALEAETIEGRGSRVRFQKGGVIASFHRPYPGKEAKLYQVRDARAFLRQLGVEP